MSSLIQASPSWVWGGSTPLPPELRDGWSYDAQPDDWLQVVSPLGARWFVCCVEGDYFMVPRCVAQPGNPRMEPGTIYAETECPALLPVKGSEEP